MSILYNDNDNGYMHVNGSSQKGNINILKHQINTNKLTKPLNVLELEEISELDYPTVQCDQTYDRKHVKYNKSELSAILSTLLNSKDETLRKESHNGYMYVSESSQRGIIDLSTEVLVKRILTYKDVSEPKEISE